MAIKFVIGVAILFCITLVYSCCTIAKKADEQSKRYFEEVMNRAYKEKEDK